MPNLKDIRTRIDSVKNTRKITKAMKMVAAAKLRKAQERMEASRPYAARMQDIIKNLAGRIEPDSHPLLAQRPEPKKTLIVVVASNRGLCGGFNTNLFRQLDRFLDEQRIAGEVQQLSAVGRKAHTYYKKSDYDVVEYYDDVIGDITYRKAKRIANDLIGSFLDGTYDSVYLVYNRFVSAIATERVVGRLFPLGLAEEFGEEDLDRDDDVEPQAAADGEVGGAGDEFIYEPELKTLLDHILPAHVEVQIMQALLESEASEQASRMTAMDNATNNASDMIDNLTLAYNRARQAYITKEIVEIVSGAESLKG